MIGPGDLCGLKVSIVGAAREGTALAQYLLCCGSRVTLTDSKPAASLQSQPRLAAHLAALQGLPGLRLALGETPADLLDVDVLFLSPGVPPTAPVVRQAREKGLPISSEPRLFTQVCTAPIVGITGSSGKTTTTTLVGRMLSAGGRNAWVGGNIGLPLTERLRASVSAGDGDERPQIAVMELSSFQLELFSPAYQGPTVHQQRSAASRAISVEGWSPQIAAITNITPNHLDRHPSMEDYARAKENILAFQSADDWAILNLDDALTRALRSRGVGRALWFSLREPVAEGAFSWGGELMLRFAGAEQALCRTGEVVLRGEHNVANILAAACCAAAAGVGPEVIRQVATTFTGVEHRLEVVRRWREITFVNDSIATSPERAIAALRSYAEPLVLLAGGRDKHLSWEEWADLVWQRVRVVVAFGEARPIIERALFEARRHYVAQRPDGRDQPLVKQVGSLEEAVAAAAGLARTGEVVLLSPGGTSFDAFDDFEERGQRFRELVAAL